MGRHGGSPLPIPTIPFETAHHQNQCPPPPKKKKKKSQKIPKNRKMLLILVLQSSITLENDGRNSTTTLFFHLYHSKFSRKSETVSYKVSYCRNNYTIGCNQHCTVNSVTVLFCNCPLFSNCPLADS